MRILNRILNAALALSLILLAWAAFGRREATGVRMTSSIGNPEATSPASRPEAAPGPIQPAPAFIAAGREAEPETVSPQVTQPSPQQAAPNASWQANVADGTAVVEKGATETVIHVAAGPATLPTPPLASVPAVITKTTPAKDAFGAVKMPANLATRSIGFYAKGCLAGGQPLPLSGPAWQAMRVSRNRNWGHPSLIRFVERFAEDVKQKDGWPGVLIGDMSMPRGGPMPFGHASHQVGLDVDIWYKPMPDHALTDQERDETPMESFLIDRAHVNPQMWTPDYEKLLRRAASYPEVARIFVNPVIKKWLCDNVKGDRKFMQKITPIGGHDDHFHVRLVCPSDNPGCVGQHVLAIDEGCGKGLDHWIEALSRPVRPPAPPAPPKPGAVAVKSKVKPPITMAELPLDCKTVLDAPSVLAAQ